MDDSMSLLCRSYDLPMSWEGGGRGISEQKKAGLGALPWMFFRRWGLVLDGFDAGEDLAFEVFEHGTAAC